MWLLDAGARRDLERAEKAGIILTAAQQEQFSARFGEGSSDSASRIYSKIGSVAQIEIRGVLTKSPSFRAMFYGGGNVTYSEIIEALAVAQTDPEIKNLEVLMDSPGGQIAGLFEAIAAMESFSKPSSVVVEDICASAAFAFACQADRIEAKNEGSRFGSVGIMYSTHTDPQEINITSTAAPKKSPDVTTDAGKAVVREELDAMHDIFRKAIATGRGVDAQKVDKDYGQGATLLSNDALSRGMIDSVAVKKAQQPVTIMTIEAKKMDRITLQAQHPDVYAAIVDLGVAQERERVTAHLIMGESSGALPVAVAAIKDGSQMTQVHTAQYMAQSMNRVATGERSAEDIAAAAALDGAKPKEAVLTAQAEADIVAKTVAESFGLTHTAAVQ